MSNRIRYVRYVRYVRYTAVEYNPGVRLLLAAGVWVTAVSAAAAPAASADQPAGVLVFAAASLKTALDELSEPCLRATGTPYRVSYSASSALAKQIDEGAPAEIFISADVEWMDYVQSRNLIQAGTRVNLVGNTLVLVAPKARPAALKIAPGFGLAAALGGGRLAVADPASVPAGLYAKAALESLGVWTSVSSHLAPADNVRAALMLVSRGEVPLGIVYRTDANADAGVVVVDTFPESTHPPIVYPAALTRRALPKAARVLTFLRGPAAQAVFARQGFLTLPKPQ